MNAILARIGILAIVAIFSFGLGYVSRSTNESTGTLKEQLRIAKNAESSASAAALMLDKSRTENLDKINDLIADVEARLEGDVCKLSRADVERLRSIR